MTVMLSDLATTVMRRMGDSAGAIWTQSEIEDYIQRGYDELTKRTGCLLGVALSPDVPGCLNYSAEWELPYILADGDANGPFQFTCEFERDFIDNARGPANHSHTWEFDSGYVVAASMATEIPALIDLPDDLHQIERATWNTIKADAMRSRDFEFDDSRYELNKGNVDAYIQDKDGLGTLRKWRVPASAYVPYSFDSSSDDGVGIIRDLTGIVNTTVVSDGFGDLIQVDGVDVFEDFGILGPIFSETSNLRIEYQRRGAALSDSQGFEVPDRYTVYVRHYAQARALEREGDGQDIELAAHYQSRYETGIQRMLKRQQAMQYQKKSILGGGVRQQARPPRVPLPWQYGRVVR